MKNDITYLGSIIRVDSETIEVEVSNEIPSAAPIINGRLYKIGQIGTFVKIPIGNIIIYGIVSSVGNSPNRFDENIRYNVGTRYLTVQLVGEKIGDREFEKGIGTYPTINDEVHLVIEKDLFDIYGKKDKGAIEIGKHSSSENLSVYTDLHKLVLRHSAILGSTGSGKSNTTVSILKAILNDYDGSRVILVDPHGEYPTAFPNAKVFKIKDETNPLYIPFWLMTFDELAYFLVGAKPSDDNKPEHRLLREVITKFKKENYRLGAGEINPNFITADSPIPFNIRKLWYEMNWWLNASFNSSTKKDEQIRENAAIEDEGDYENLIGARFTSHLINGAVNPPYKSAHQEFYSYEKKLLTRIKDSRFDFLFNPGDYKDENSPKDLHNLLNQWIGSESKLAILDLSNVPFEVLDITIGLITRFVYDSMFWGRNESYTGKNRCLLLAFEEAHTYLNKNENNSYSKEAVEKIFKEGRKFGLGALVISQRPSEISETILAQVGTLIALRLTNSGDQSVVKSSAPDNLNSLINLLPALRTGEAIIVGEAIKIPSRVRISLNTPRPTSSDPELINGWSIQHPYNANNYKPVIKKIREQRF
ncbi:MAG: helicase HerA-like domain-containing protein [Melioribacteraceae bacterium]